MSSKRRREDDSDSDEGDSYGQHHFKKSKSWVNAAARHEHAQFSTPPSLSLQPSPSPPRIISDVEALTPANSDNEETDSQPMMYGGFVRSSQPNDSNYDVDMEEDNQDVTSQPPDSPFMNNAFMRPAMLNASLFSAEPVNCSGRTATPMHPTFKRGVMTGLGLPSEGPAGGLYSSSGYANTNSMQPPKSRQPEREDVDVERSRRMPSPISENEDIPDTPTALTQSQLSRLSFSQSTAADQMDTEEATVSLAPPPTPRGRKRSGALTGMGRFSMGYRDDCEKCRQRVPGHYSHFLP